MSNKPSKVKFSIEYLLDKLKDVSVDINLSNLKHYEFRMFDAGQAFMSEIVQLKLEWHKATPLNSVILKIPGFQNPTNEEYEGDITVFLEKAHKRECDFYELFGSLPIQIPRFYYSHLYKGGKSDGLIIMEDLSEIACTVNMVDGLSNAQMERMVIELAQIYAISIRSNNSWQQLLGREPDEINKFIAEIKKLNYQLIQMNPDMFEDLMEELEPAFDIAYFQQCFYNKRKFGFAPGLVHGDLWAANILWKRDENGKATAELQAVIDWQHCMAGNPGGDLARCLGLNTSSDYRYKNEERLLKLYCNTVNKLMGNEIAITFDQLHKAYRASFPYVAIVLGFGVPLYSKMSSIVGDPADPALQQELMDRVYCFFKDTVEVLKLQQQA